MLAVAVRAPGFAGMLWDSTSRLVIRTIPDADPSAVLAAIGDPGIRRRFRGVHDAVHGNRFVVVADAAFDFRMLADLRDSLRKTSGWVTGEVSETCVDRPGWFDVELDPYDTVLLCQTEALQLGRRRQWGAGVHLGSLG
jgi:hypothetical protein